MDLTLNINGETKRVTTHVRATLLDVLRDELDLTGAKPGCAEGQCGACTVLMDGKAMRSCMVSARAAQRRRIVTIEGLARDGRLHPAQQAFLDTGAYQCGYCTPGMILSAVDLLERNTHPDEPAIREALNGNVCRCGTHPRIVEAVRMASEALRRG